MYKDLKCVLNDVLFIYSLSSSSSCSETNQNLLNVQKMEEEQIEAPQVFTKEELAELSSGKGENFIFDISKIKDKDYEKLLASIVKLSKKKLKSLTFTLESYYQVYKEDIPGSQANAIPHIATVIKANEPGNLKQSAFRKNQYWMDFLLIALRYILPRTKSLQNFGLQMFQISLTDLLKLCASLQKCNSLKYVQFHHVSIQDDGLELVTRALKGKNLTVIQFRSCGLTDVSIPSLKLLMGGRSTIQGESFFTLLDLRDNSYSYKILLELGDTLAITQLKTFDLRYNQMIDSKIVRNIRKTLPKIEILINSQKRQKKFPIIFSEQAKQINVPELKEKARSLKALLENAIIHADASSDDDYEEIIELGPGIKIVGKDAPDFAASAHDIIQIAQSIYQNR